MDEFPTTLCLNTIPSKWNKVYIFTYVKSAYCSFFIVISCTLIPANPSRNPISNRHLFDSRRVLAVNNILSLSESDWTAQFSREVRGQFHYTLITAAYHWSFQQVLLAVYELIVVVW